MHTHLHIEACTRAHTEKHAHMHRHRHAHIASKHIVCMYQFGVSLGMLEKRLGEAALATVSLSVLSLMMNAANKDVGLSQCIFS